MNAGTHAHAQPSRASAPIGRHLRDARARQQLPIVTTKRRWPHVDVDSEGDDASRRTTPVDKRNRKR